MHDDREKLRQSIIVTILAAYFTPILALTFLSVNANDRWLLFSVSLLVAIVGTIFMIMSFLRWEFIGRVSIPEPALETANPTTPTDHEELNHLQTALKRAESREEQLVIKLDNAKQKWHAQKKQLESLQRDLNQVQNEHKSLLHHSQEQLRKKDLLLTEYAQTVNDLRSTMEKKQDQIEKLQDSVSDLSYDLDTLLKLSEFESVEHAQSKQTENTPAAPPPVPKAFDVQNASMQLKKCVNMAQKLTSNQFASSSRFRDLSIDNSALDQRRLFESFRSETSCLIIMYSMKEREVLFANDMTKPILGWDPEEFVEGFNKLIHRGREEWQNAIISLSHQQEAHFQLSMRTRSDEVVTLECGLCLIPTGAFKNHAVGVMYSLSN